MKAVWVEFPAKNVERALKFYETVFDLPHAEIYDDGARQTAVIQHEGVGISLNQTNNFEPSDRGVLVYMDAGDDLTTCLGRVPAAGGQIAAEKTSMGEGAGYYAIVHDTEGNAFALYSSH
jgi:predicted enzyme related to lactoylglutathione lyase